jgi:hypothetical protein
MINWDYYIIRTGEYGLVRDPADPTCSNSHLGLLLIFLSKMVKYQSPNEFDAYMRRKQRAKQNKKANLPKKDKKNQKLDQWRK